MSDGGMDLSKMGAKVGNSTYKEQFQHSRITVKFNDKTDRDLCREQLVDIHNSFTPKVLYKGKPVEVWRVEPRYKHARNEKLFNRARMLARELGMRFETDIKVQTSWDDRGIYNKHTEELLAYQDTET